MNNDRQSFNTAFKKMRENGNLIQYPASDTWTLNGWRAVLSDGGYGETIYGPINPKTNKPIFLAYLCFTAQSVSYITFSIGDATMFNQVGNEIDLTS
jgi:hypothetical protein